MLLDSLVKMVVCFKYLSTGMTLAALVISGTFLVSFGSTGVTSVLLMFDVIYVMIAMGLGAASIIGEFTDSSDSAVPSCCLD